MIPINEFSGVHLDSIFIYLSILGILLLVGTIIRSKIVSLKRWHIPASLIAGLIGLILGPYFIGIIPKEMTSFWSALSGRLIVLVFAPMMMGKVTKPEKGIMKDVTGSILWSFSASFLQYAVPILLSVFFLTPIFNVSPLFATIVEQGWAGGHGTAGGMGQVFEDLGYIDGASLSLTSATIGLAFGIVMGTILINIAVRKGEAKLISNYSGTFSENERELFSCNEAPVGMKNTVSSSVVDSLAFHFSMLGLAVLIGWILNKLIKSLINFSVAWFVTSLFGGIIVNFIVHKLGFGDYIDKNTLSRIQGTSMDFLVVGAIASVNVPVVVEYAIPLTIQQVTMALFMLFWVGYIGRKSFAHNWFENTIVLFGTFCGVAATGLLLLRACDPELKSGATEVYAGRAPFTSPFIGGGLLTSITPGLIIKFGALKIGLAYLSGIIFCMILCKVTGVWGRPHTYSIKEE
ncbi:sodium/glutamate symporter [Peptoniphilus catoniae]|uniref:sodium/glutamate symporter n=1 Tax=Peptoniphilus catoniae TaxID=1660341 RepID=UPI0010FDD2B8|nr:hypothetical protein [Peptoniphilus catoniae]